MTHNVETESAALTADDWEQAVSEVCGWYPEDVFPTDSRSLDGISGAMARRTCLNIIKEAWRIRAQRIDGSSEA